MKTAILDVDSIAYACGNPNKVLDEQGNPIKVLSEKGNMVFQYVDKTEDQLKESCDIVMTDILNSCNAESYIGFIKGIKTIEDRLRINPEYKQNRSKEAPKWWETVKWYLCEKWGVIAVNYLEVDDACSITRKAIPDSFIVACDKDLLHLEGNTFDWKKKEWHSNTKNTEHYYLWKQMITGDTVDNIVGIFGRGEKYAEKVLLGNEVKTPEYDYSIIVYKEYIMRYGVTKGIQEFYKNYNSLKMLDSKEGFTIPQPIQWKKKETVEELFK